MMTTSYTPRVTIRPEVLMIRSAVLVAIVALLLAPSLAVAQTTEPIGIVSPDETSVSRSYDNPSAFVNGTIGIFALGAIAETESEATGLMRTMPAIVAAGMSGELEGMDFAFEDPVDVPVTPIGDDTTATRMAFTMFGTVDGEVVLLAVRQATWVQVLIGMGAGESAVQAELEALARALQPRWPSGDPVTVRPDGLRAGGIFNMMPLPEDLAAGFELDPEFEEGPGPGTVAVVPTPSAQVTPPVQVTPAPGETPTPIRDVPLLPTPTPAVGVTPPTQVETPATGQTPITLPTPTVAAPAATPPPNPRLALPFGVTVEILLPMELATVSEEDGSCSGAGLLDGLTTGGSLTLLAAEGTAGSATAPLSGPGMVAFDTEKQREVCYFSAIFTGVPPRASYTLMAGDSVLARFSYAELTTGEPILVELGGE
jgi:hypothetical protein